MGYFYNPNIHPLIEFRRRLKAVKVLAEQMKIEILADETYGLRDFLDGVDHRLAQRCRQCYLMRLRQTAKVARERRLDGFSTTLLVSCHQEHETVRQVGQQVAAETGVPFLYYDWRSLADKGHEQAKRRSLYCQQYCGCIFSEYERFKDTGLHLYPPGAGGRQGE